MRILLVGAGGVDGAFAAIAAWRDFFGAIVVADHDPARAEKSAATDERYVAAQVDASDAASLSAPCREHRITHVMNAVDPVPDVPVFERAAGRRHPGRQRGPRPRGVRRGAVPPPARRHQSP